MLDSKLLDILIKDQKKFKGSIYYPGPYWEKKCLRAAHNIKKNGLSEFRGITKGIGSSYTDGLTLDARNESNFKGRLIGKLYSLPIINSIFNTQLHITNTYLNTYLKNLSIVYENDQKVLMLLKKYKFEDTVKFGCLQKFSLDNKEYSTHYLNMAHRIEFLSKTYNFNKINSYFEIGGGFGANIHFLLSNFKNIKKILYLDIVPNIYVGTQYLKKFFNDSVKDYLYLRKKEKISFANNDDLEILCVPPWLIEKLDLQIDHFHNANSFVEMTDKIIKNYCHFIKRFNTKEVSLITYDNHNPNTTFEPSLLNKYFGNKLKLSSENLLINEYKRNLLFLTNN